MAKKRKQSDTGEQPAKKKQVASVHIQARLHPNVVREADAVLVYKHMKNLQHLTDREIVRESLIAYGQMVDSGWQPQEDVTEVKLSANVLNMLKQMTGLVSKLASMDFSQARNTDGSAIDTTELQRELSEFDKSASDMLGQAIFFDVDEDGE